MPKWVNGAGIKKVVVVNEAMNANLYWRILQEPNALWSKVLKEKYIGNKER